MNKQIHSFKGFDFYLKKDSELSCGEKSEMHNLLVDNFPDFKRIYDKHGYYSTIRPQMSFLVKKEGVLVGTGKFLWKNINIGRRSIKLFGFGLIIAKKYQGIGLGTALAKLDIAKARDKGADLLYGSTSNKIVIKMLSNLGFKSVITKVFYKDFETEVKKEEKKHIFCFEFKKGLIKRINTLPEVYIGVGPI